MNASSIVDVVGEGGRRSPRPLKRRADDSIEYPVSQTVAEGVETLLTAGRKRAVGSAVPKTVEVGLRLGMPNEDDLLCRGACTEWDHKPDDRGFRLSG